MLKHLSAVTPIVMSAAAVAVVLIHLTFIGPAPQPDEGTEAHLWQLLMVGQLPIVMFFALTRLPDNPGLALRVCLACKQPRQSRQSLRLRPFTCCAGKCVDRRGRP